MQLSEHTETFSELGIHLIGVTYDSLSDLKTFHQRQKLKYPLVQDKDSTLIKMLGILNTGPEPGDSAFGIPYPGIFLVDQNGIIRGKFAEADFRDRPNVEHLVSAALELSQ